MTKTEAVAEIVSNVKLLCGITDTTSDTRIGAFASHYYGMASGITHYGELPDDLIPYVTDTVVKAWRRRGAEEVSSATALGVSETYIDIEASLRKHLRSKCNPLSMNYIANLE